MKMSILVVDDSIINLSAVEQKLKDRYDVATANSGDKALRYLKNEKPDLILLDIKMDNMDGIETLKQIREMENGTDIPVIMLTGVESRDMVVESAKLGIHDYLLKPFSSVELLKRVRRVFGQDETENEEGDE